MSQEFARAFYHSSAWRKNRRNYMRRVIDTPLGPVPPGMCERCFEVGELKAADTVHHIVHLTPENIDDPHVTLGYDNLMRVCRDCHAELHSGRTSSRVKFDEGGNMVPPADAEREFREEVRRLMSTTSDRRNIYREMK